MSKGSKPATTVTQQQIPAWLQNTLQPLLKGSTEKILDFQNQGNAVLQGKNYKNVQSWAAARAADQARIDARGPGTQGKPPLNSGT